MGSISSKGREKAADVGENGLKEGQPPFSISSKLDHYDQGLGTNQSPDQAVEIGDVGGRGNMTVQNDELKKVIEQGRKEIKETQEKLNSSLTTPIVESEAKVRPVTTSQFRYVLANVDLNLGQR